VRVVAAPSSSSSSSFSTSPSEDDDEDENEGEYNTTCFAIEYYDYDCGKVSDGAPLAFGGVADGNVSTGGGFVRI
jgi:hypothetical protein